MVSHLHLPISYGTDMIKRIRKKKNIVFLLLDSVRAGDVYGNMSLPNIQKLIKTSAIYTNTISPGTWTATSHASLFTGRNVTNISEVSRDFFSPSSVSIDPWMVKTRFLPENADTIASKLSRKGYYSILFSNNPFLTSFTNLGSGFDRIYDMWMHSNVKYDKKIVKRVSAIINGGHSARRKMFRISNALTMPLPRPIFDKMYLHLRKRLDRKVADTDGTYRLDRGASDTNVEMKDYFQTEYNGLPHFIFVNLIEAHENYPLLGKDKGIIQDKWLYMSGIEELDGTVAGKLHKAYLRRIKYLDSMVGKTLDTLKEGGMLENASVIITSDHGQFFGEHGLLYHSLFPYDEGVKVPLVAINYENGKPTGPNEHIDSPVSLTSLHDAVYDLASGRCDYLDGNLRSGRYVLSEHTGISEGWDEEFLRMIRQRSKYAGLIYAAKSKYNSRATAVYKGDMKLIHYFGKMKDELYNISTDPHETDNILGGHRHVANGMLRGANLA